MADESSATSQSYRGFEDISQGGASSGRPAFEPQPSAAALASDPTTSRTNLLAASPPPRRGNDAFIPQLPTQAETSAQKMKRRAKSAVGKTAGGMVKNVKKVWTDAPSKHELLEFSRQTWIEVKSRKVSSCLGICACLLVVFVLALLASILSYAPVIFLKLAEGDAGQLDLSLEAASGTRNTSLQYAATTAQLARYSEDAARTSPRIILDMLAYGFDCSNVYDPFNLTQLYTGPDQADPTFPSSCGVRKASGTLYVADQLREEFAGIGTAFPYPETIPRGHAVLHSSLFNTLGLRGVGDTFVLSIKPQDDLLRQWRPLSNNTVNRWLHLPLAVAGTFSKAKGKFDTASTNVLMELADLMKTVGEFAGPAFLNQSVRDEISAIDPYSVSSFVYANMPPDRSKPYISSDFTKVRQKLVRWASPLIYYAGISQVSADLPVAEKVESYQFFALFLGLLLNLIAIILLALCSMLIGSLLLVSVETRTFQMGVLRMLGMTRYGAIILILMQAYLYAIPGYILGLIFAGLTYFGITRVFKSLLNVSLPPTLSGFAIGLATLAGLVIPILAAILPIRQALRKNLHDALDTRRSKVHAVAYKLTRSDGDDFSWTIVAVGSALALFGFLIYYILPLALLSSNFALLLNIFFFIILGMLLGLVLLALNIQPLLERYFAKLVFFWENAGVRTLLVKNMIAHRTRNRKTTLMYSLALAFIIFITSSYQLQATSFVYAEQQAHGGYIAIEASDTSGGIVNRVPSITKLEAALAADPDVSGWAYETVQLSDLLDNVDDVLVTNLGHTYTDKQPLYALSPNFFNTVLSGFVRTANQLGSFSLLDTVYSAIGSSGLVLGQTYHKQVGARVGQDVLLQWTERNESIETVQETDRYTRLRCLALMNAGAVVRWSKYPIVLGQDAVMSLPSYLRMLQVAEERQQNFNELSRLYNSIEDLPMSRLIVKFRGSGLPSSDTRKRITRALNDVIAGAPGVSIYDYNDAIDPIKTGNQIIGLMFAITTAIAMLICFFSLSSSMLTNINEQSKEIGVLRALGLKRFSLRRAYVYEAWVILITSSATGIMVGVVVAWTMGLQQVLFTQLPIPFTFPWLVTAVIFGLSLVLAVLSSLGPVNAILRLPVVQILRLLN